jgi:hypothetical protein
MYQLAFEILIRRSARRENVGETRRENLAVRPSKHIEMLIKRISKAKALAESGIAIILYMRRASMHESCSAATGVYLKAYQLSRWRSSWRRWLMAKICSAFCLGNGGMPGEAETALALCSALALSSAGSAYMKEMKAIRTRHHGES